MAGYEDNTLDAETLALFANAPERFVRKLRRDGGCVVWIASRFRTGYGACMDLDGKITGAHRVSYKLYHGPIADGLDVMHSCDRRECVNPLHLSAGTRKENMLDCVSKLRHTIGERNGMSRLKEQEVREIRALVKSGTPQKDIARQFSVSKSVVCWIAKRKSWAYITD